jgi:hypothetical protein
MCDNQIIQRAKKQWSGTSCWIKGEPNSYGVAILFRRGLDVLVQNEFHGCDGRFSAPEPGGRGLCPPAVQVCPQLDLGQLRERSSKNFTSLTQMPAPQGSSLPPAANSWLRACRFLRLDCLIMGLKLSFVNVYLPNDAVKRNEFNDAT